MTLKEVAKLRLSAQHILHSTFKKPKEVVSFMGAMQAQDYAMSQWALGLRLPNATEQTVLKAIDKGEVIRTHLLRPTWHLVSPNDIYWMLELSADSIRSTLKGRHKELGITPAVLKKTFALLEDALQGRHLTREEIEALLHKARIKTNENRLSHLLFAAELEALICSGQSKNGKPTYALLSERVKKPKAISRDKALEKLALTYFTSHGPATLPDFTWWAGLGIKDARNALDAVKSKLASTTIGNETFWFSKTLSQHKTTGVHLLPAFDEFIISYKSRSVVMASEHHTKAVSSNGIFYPVIVVDGQVEGLWKRSFKKDTVLIEAQLFKPAGKALQQSITKAADSFGEFTGKKASVTFR